MTFPPHQTEPSMRRVILPEEEGTGAPPKILLWGVIIVFILVIVGGIGGVFVFRDALRPSQQQRIIDIAPFMKAFLPPTPVGGALPTIEPNSASNQSAMDLLNMPLGLPTETPASVTVFEATAEPTENIASATPNIQPTEAPTVTPTATMPPTVAPLPTETPTINGGAVFPTAQNVVSNASTSVPVVLPVSERIFGLRYQKQTWNNCGPATLTMALSYYGWQNDQSYAQNILKPNREDKNVSPDELVNFVNTQTQLKAMARIGGDLNVLKTLIANKFAVVIERGIRFEGSEWLGHYQALVAYDDTQSAFYAYDSYIGKGDADEGVKMNYRELDEDWRAFNRLFIVIYLPQDEAYLKTLLGDLAEVESSALRAFEVAQSDARQNPQDPIAWFNMGTALTTLERYQEASNAFDQAFRFSVPYRILWYQFAPFKAYYETGRYEDVLRWAQINLGNAQELEEMYYWRGRVYQAQGKADQARVEYNRALGYNTNFSPAREALRSLG